MTPETTTGRPDARPKGRDDVLFGHLDRNAFMLFAGANRRLYAHVALAVYREFYGTSLVRTPLRAEVVEFVAVELRERPELWTEDEALADLPAPVRRGRRGFERKSGGAALDLLTAKAHHVYGRLVACGWIEEEPHGFNLRAEMPAAAMMLADRLSAIQTDLGRLVGGTIVNVRGNLAQLAAAPAENALGLPETAETAVGFVRHLRAIHASLRDVERGLTATGTVAERMRTFVEDFIEAVLVRDYHRIMSENHPYRFRAAIVAEVDRLLDDEPAKLRIAEVYVENRVRTAAGECSGLAEALAAVDGHLATVGEAFRNVDEFLGRINEFRARLESRLRNTLKYMERGDRSAVGKLAEAIQGLDRTRAREAALGLPPADPPSAVAALPRHWCEDGLARPTHRPAPAEAALLDVRKPDPAVGTYKILLEAHAALFAVGEERVRRYVEANMDASGTFVAGAARIATVGDFLAFEAALGFVHRRPDGIDSLYEIKAAEGQHDGDWLRCRNFTVTRRKPAARQGALG